MYYLKHYFDEDGRHPNIKNLDVKFIFNDGKNYCLSVTDTLVSGNPLVTVLTEKEFYDALEVEYNKIREFMVYKLYEAVKEMKQSVVDSWWHSSEITASIAVKISEAYRVMENIAKNENFNSPLLSLEASVRGVPVETLATKVIENHGTLIQAEAVISGHRGKLTDMLYRLKLDRTSLEAAEVSLKTLTEFDLTQGFYEIQRSLGLESVNQ